MALAHMNSVFIVCADQCGVERGCTFLGSQNSDILEYHCWRIVEGVQGKEMFTHFDLDLLDSS